MSYSRTQVLNVPLDNRKFSSCLLAHSCALEHGANGRAPQLALLKPLLCPLPVRFAAFAMAASDNIAAAAADLRRLASLNEADLQSALAYMGREPFRRLRRAVGRTATPLPSDDEGGSGPGGALSSASQNVNNLDTASLADTFLGAMASPAASQLRWTCTWHPPIWRTPPRLRADPLWEPPPIQAYPTRVKKMPLRILSCCTRNAACLLAHSCALENGRAPQLALLKPLLSHPPNPGGPPAPGFGGVCGPPADTGLSHPHQKSAVAHFVVLCT